MTSRQSRKKSKPRGSKTITRAKARELASRHVAAQLFKEAKVLDGAHEPGASYLVVPPQDVWIVYMKTSSTGLHSSEIVVICKRTGRIIHEGLSHDEE